ncbi:DUF2809 domain-containing protein [Mucilaginibacter sp. PAMB04168]|uniref:ribosomal maturation YjgA family protein n=1 Tax=Mucilaginibacter sp. PAMB04168 TaxID=3138567 RepID=UPI0031F60B99
MSKSRWVVLSAVFIVIIAGLASRKVAFIPLWVGDTLWALMVYLMVRFLFMERSIGKVALISLAFSFAIEFSQLYQAEWINRVRNTVPGHLILGRGFLWGDLLAYIPGVLLGLFIDALVFKKQHVSK